MQNIGYGEHNFHLPTYLRSGGVPSVRDIYGLLTKRGVKMAGYRPSSFFVFMDWGVEVNKHANEELGQYPVILTSCLAIKGFIIWKKNPFFYGTLPIGQDSAIMPARVANHSAGFGSSCPVTELAIKQRNYILCINQALTSKVLKWAPAVQPARPIYRALYDGRLRTSRDEGPNFVSISLQSW